MANHLRDQKSYDTCKLLSEELNRVITEELRLRTKLLDSGVRDVSKFVNLPQNRLDQLDEESADYDDKRLCHSCKHICFFSCVACECSKSKVSCLRHTHYMCRCPIDKRYMMVWSTAEEMYKAYEEVKEFAEKLKLKEDGSIDVDMEDDEDGSEEDSKPAELLAPGVIEDLKRHAGYKVDLSEFSPLSSMPRTGQLLKDMINCAKRKRSEESIDVDKIEKKSKIDVDLSDEPKVDSMEDAADTTILVAEKESEPSKEDADIEIIAEPKEASKSDENSATMTSDVASTTIDEAAHSSAKEVAGDSKHDGNSFSTSDIGKGNATTSDANEEDDEISDNKSSSESADKSTIPQDDSAPKPMPDQNEDTAAAKDSKVDEKIGMPVEKTMMRKVADFLTLKSAHKDPNDSKTATEVAPSKEVSVSNGEPKSAETTPTSVGEKEESKQKKDVNGVNNPTVEGSGDEISPAKIPKEDDEDLFGDD